MMVEVPVNVCQKAPQDERRKFVAGVIESCWCEVSMVVDVAWNERSQVLGGSGRAHAAGLDALRLTVRRRMSSPPITTRRNWGDTTESTRDDLQTAELLISTIFVGELALRCYAHDRDQLLYATNILDSFIILAAFVLSLVEVYTPLLAVRAARFIHLGATTSRCGRAARNTTRAGVEMRNFFDRAGKGLAARVAARHSESDIAPLFVDVSRSRELSAVFDSRPWEQSRRRTLAGLDEDTLPLIEHPVLSAAASLKRLAKAEIENASAVAVTYRAREQRKQQQQQLKAPKQAPAEGDLEAAPRPDSDTADQGRGEKKRTITSARALVAVLEHTLHEARTKGAPPPRLFATLRKDLDLVFLNRDI